MSIYFFNVVHRYGSNDDTGTECFDVPAARAEAMRAIGGMLKEAAEDLSDDDEWRMEVTDDRAQVLFVVRVIIETEHALERRSS